MAYIAKLQKGQPFSREAAFSAMTQPENIKNDPGYEYIYDYKRLGGEFPMWQDAYKALISRISHKEGILSEYVAQRESAPSPQELRHLYGPGVYKVEIRGPMTDKSGVMKRYGKLAIYTVVIPFEEKDQNQAQTCAHCSYFSAKNDICLKNKWMTTPDEVCNNWEEIIKKNSQGPTYYDWIVGDVGSMDNVVADGLETQDAESPAAAAEMPEPKTKEPLAHPPDQYEFIRALAHKIDPDTESED
jgi:hypothetical protein